MTINYELIKKIDDEIRSKDDYINELYYQISCSKCIHLDQYISKYNVTNPLDIIVLAQLWMNYDLAKEKLEKINLTENQRKRLNEIIANNDAWYETLNPMILDDKYAFLDKYLSFIVTDIRTQQLILNLGENELFLFSKMYEKLDKETSNVIPYISRILGVISTSITASRLSFTTYNGEITKKQNQEFSNISKELTKEELTEHDLEILIYVFSNNNLNVFQESLEDIRNLEKNILGHVTENMKRFKNQTDLSKTDIDSIKSLLLLRCYGISLDYAKKIIKIFNIDGINIPSENNYISMYRSIYNIVNETDVNKLFVIYDDISNNCEFSLDYMTTALFENGLRDIFLKNYTDSAYKCNNDNYEIIDGVKVYDAGTDFKIILTSVGSYQPELGEQENYANYWNSRSIRSHGNCCSLIANNNLSTAVIRNICLGFSDFEDGMLLLVGDSDINSTPTSRNLNTQDKWGRSTKFMSADSIIDNTRSDYNELVFERRDLSPKREQFKKNPDYIVLFEELINDNINELDEVTKQLLTEQEKIKNTSLKAAKDFNIPIVKINREKCALSELNKINNMVNEFYKTHDSKLLTRIVIEFENNRMGLRYPHNYLREKYFSKDYINKTLNSIIANINTIKDKQLKASNLDTLKNVISNEKTKFIKNTTYIHHSQELGINSDSLIEYIDKSSNDSNNENIGGKEI